MVPVLRVCETRQLGGGGGHARTYVYGNAELMLMLRCNKVMPNLGSSSNLLVHYEVKNEGPSDGSPGGSRTREPGVRFGETPTAWQVPPHAPARRPLGRLAPAVGIL